MSRRELVTRAALGVGAVLCLALAVVFVLFAVDVARWREAMNTSDAR